MDKYGTKQILRTGFGLFLLFPLYKFLGCEESKAQQRKTVLQLGLGKINPQFGVGECVVKIKAFLENGFTNILLYKGLRIQGE